MKQSLLDELRPTARARVMDLVCKAGINVRDWAHFKGGKAKAAANPKYCYNWSFLEPHKVVVLNLWYEQMHVAGNTVEQRHDFRALEKRNRQVVGKGVWVRRAKMMDDAIRTAYTEGLPVRVVVCDGTRRDRRDPEAKASVVGRRLLDGAVWAVTQYDLTTGKCVITRGAVPAPFVDQFSLEGKDPVGAERHPVSGMAYSRDPLVRSHALQRANGRCEWCSSLGFRTPSGSLFLETHHVVPLSEKGADHISNVAALCPTHHREAHHGAARSEMRVALLAKLASSNGKPARRARAKQKVLRLSKS